MANREEGGYPSLIRPTRLRLSIPVREQSPIDQFGYPRNLARPNAQSTGEFHQLHERHVGVQLAAVSSSGARPRPKLSIPYATTGCFWRSTSSSAVIEQARQTLA